jgi:kynurenine formamidase
MRGTILDELDEKEEFVSRHILDLSISIESGLPSDPGMMIPKIDYVTHEMGAAQMEHFFPGLKKEQLPEGLGWALEMVSLTTHSGTHLDAPYHYHPTQDGGQPALTIVVLPGRRAPGFQP